MTTPEHEVFISFGSNVERCKHFGVAMAAVKRHFAFVVSSPVYESEPVGFDGPAFYNSVLLCRTAMPLDALQAWLKDLEQQCGRQSGAHQFAPRTLDMDILLFDDWVGDEPVALPRQEILEHAFVLRPLADIAPMRRHPVVNKTYGQLWAEFNHASQPLRQVRLTLENYDHP